MRNASQRGVVSFVDRRFAQPGSDPSRSGTIEVIYYLEDDPDSLRAVTVDADNVPSGLKKGDGIAIADGRISRQE
jgi:hypothetical protein